MLTNGHILNAFVHEFGGSVKAIQFVQEYEPELFQLMLDNDPRVYQCVSFYRDADFETLDDLADEIGYDSFETMQEYVCVVQDEGLDGYILIVE